MLKSMTGFGRGEAADEERSVSVEIKSVNNRYMDIYVRVPRKYSFLDNEVRKLIKKSVFRGKIEVTINFEALSEAEDGIRLNEVLLRQYMKALDEAAEISGLENMVTVENLVNMPDVLVKDDKVEDEESIIATVAKAVNNALVEFNDMRRKEGVRLCEDVRSRCGEIAEEVVKIEARAPEIEKAYYERLLERLNKILEEKTEVQEDRLIAEAAVFAEKVAVAEEIVRLKSHIEQFEATLLKENTSEGKRLDFIIQEMNREINTIGSKANDLDITKQVLRIKGEIEKMREQVQNIE